MKQLLALCIVCLFSSNINAQVKIGGTATNADPSSILELDGGNNKGLLLPRMRKMDMLAIVNPAEGLTLYLTDEQVTYLRRSGNWVKLSGAGDPFALPYAASFNEAVTPVLSLTNSMVGGTGIYGATIGGSAGAGVHGHATAGSAYGIRGTGLLGRGGYFSSNFNHALVTDSGRVGFGTLNPSAFVEIDGTRNSSDTTVIINDDVNPMIQFKKAGINKSYIKQEGNNLVLRPNDNNFAGKVILQGYNQGGWMFVDADGNSSFGQDPSTFNGTPDNARVHIKGNSENVLTLESPVGSFGPRLRFIEKTGNTINHLASLRANDDELTFSHKNARYEWLGNGGSAAMVLKHPEGLFQPPLLHFGGMLGIGVLTDEFPVDAAIHIFDPFGLSNTMILNSPVPFINFQKSSVDKGFIQLLDNDMKFGTVATNDNGRIILRTNGADRMWIDSTGYVTIGSGAKTGPVLNGPYKLAVKGRIAATEFNVVSSGSWPDYVFDSSYKMRTLEETEAFIKLNKHLPTIPSAAVIEKNGYGLNEMQKRTIETIEQLTLHLIEADKQIKELKQEIKMLKVPCRTL